jgi:hypothetical protein
MDAGAVVGLCVTCLADAMRLRIGFVALELLEEGNWGWLAAHPVVYGWAAQLGVRDLGWLARDTDRIRVLGLAPGWTNGRGLPAAQGRSFRERYAAHKKKETRT